MASEYAIEERVKFHLKFDQNSLDLKGLNLEYYNSNPHLRQVFANKREFILAGRKLEDEDRLLNNYKGREKYVRRKGEWKTVDHWGQRKLLMSEIEFLTLYGKSGSTIIYAGAAPGQHTNYLSDLFPDMKFILIDPSPFQTRATDKIRILSNTFFDDKLAHKFGSEYQEILFISDIRTVSSTMTPKETEECCKKDMENQARWHKIMKPKASMFKLKFPYTAGKTTYFDGDIFLPVWGPITTTECRLVVKEEIYKEYDHEEYEQMMFHFNTITRTMYWDHNIVGEGIDHCYDCASEIHILEKYLKQYNLSHDENSISKMSKDISKQISNSRNLSLHSFLG